MRPFDRFVRTAWVFGLVVGVTLQATPARAHWHARAHHVWHAPAHRPWRPRWWPAALPVGTGQAAIVIRLSQEQLFVHDGRRGWHRFRIATGRHGATPRGWFHIASKIRQPAWDYHGHHVPGGIAANPLGVCWLGLAMPPGWRGAPIGLHGTNAPWFIGLPVSHGCIRLRNRDALALYRMVPTGAPVWIQP